MNRWKASAIHLCISLLVIGTVATGIFLLWYTRGLWRIAGLDHLFVLLLGIDLVAGPLLTLIVYNRAKPELRRDLTIVGLLQFAFLCYGLHAAWISRPVFLVGNADRIDVVFANELDGKDLSRAGVPEARSLPWHHPRLVGAVLPQDANAQEKIMLSAFSGGEDVQDMPERYVPYAQVAPDLLKSSAPATEATAPGSDDARALAAGLAAAGRKADEVSLLLLMSSRGSGSMLVDARTGEPLWAVDINAYTARQRANEAKARARKARAP